MRQFDVFENPNRANRSHTPYLIVLQSDVSLGKQTVIVAPIARRQGAQESDRAMIALEIQGEACIVQIQALAAVRQTQLNAPPLNAAELAPALPRAIDYLFLGM